MCEAKGSIFGQVSYGRKEWGLCATSPGGESEMCSKCSSSLLCCLSRAASTLGHSLDPSARFCFPSNPMAHSNDHVHSLYCFCLFSWTSIPPVGKFDSGFRIDRIGWRSYMYICSLALVQSSTQSWWSGHTCLFYLDE